MAMDEVGICLHIEDFVAFYIIALEILLLTYFADAQPRLNEHQHIS